MSDGERFVARLLAKLQREEPGGPSSCRWDGVARVVALTYRRAGADPAEVVLSLPPEATEQYAGGIMDQDVRDVWGEGVESVEGAARFATVHLTELVQTSRESPLRLRLTPTGIRRQRSDSEG